jgi:hypothetical protein
LLIIKIIHHDQAVSGAHGWSICKSIST